MSLDTVVEDIRDEARDRAEEIRSEADDEAEAILEDARADAEEIEREAEQAAEREIAQEREQRLSAAKLEAKQERLQARKELLADVRDAVETELAALSGERREELTRALLDAAAAEVDATADVAVYGRADDADLLESLCTEYEGYEYAGEYDCLGGVVVESEQSRVRVNNTFDSVLEGVWEDELKTVSDRLFEQ